ncbi:Hypothetical protein R9X50_00718000 [Acrodontium crateriforme]|uniref:Ubiquitination network signaling protein n=1 Tax=Acrodontium crateriforme TaxID=150365 RepID=A0AAQ3RC17_9PEZI|nr:Hypothetical protein R9X50_00718000 [Acrodontium crateriforme]
MPPKAKSKNAPNQHDKRHESGLAAPGRRITKQRSNGLLNGHLNGKPISAVPAPALPATGLNSGFRFSHPVDDSTSHTSARDDGIAAGSVARARTSSETSVEEGGLYAMADGQDTAPTSPVVDVHAAAFKHKAQSANGTMSTVSTILTYYPLRDAISILILLLSLPPTLVLVIQTLFASLTFVPPTAGISLSTLPNIKDMFNASNLGYPALATILIVDLIFWVCWLPVWKPLQSIFLDLSQAVIAISLSGAAAGSGGPTYSIASCTLIVCVVHVLRYKAIHLTALDYLRSVIHKLDIGVPFDVPPIATSFFSSVPIDRGWVFTIVRTILGIHIVSQGVTTCIRRSLVKANERDQSVPTISKSDTEATAGSEPASRLSSGFNESNQQSHVSSNSEGRASVLSPAQREGKSRESNTKKKKRQANQVRGQQPLWAAIASTKVTFVKEMEQRDAADDARDASSMNGKSSLTLATAAINATTNRIWISEVGATDISFSLDLSIDAAKESVDNIQEGLSIGAGIDKSKPFYVRVNGASWSSTRIMSSATGEQSNNLYGDRFDGEIYGLAPLSSYHCEIVGIASGSVLCTVSFITQAAPSAEQAAAIVPQPQHPALRPSSPITTLKQSIQSAEAKLNEIRNRTRKVKKDQRSVHSDIRKEINVLKSKLESSGGLDDKQERRLLQINQHKNQAEEATAELKGQIDALGEIPSAELAEFEAKRRVWQAARDAKIKATKDYDNAKAEADRELNALKAEICQTENKREKLASRHTQRTQELEKLASKHQSDMTAKQKREFERAQVFQARQDEENQFRLHINTMEAEYMTISAKTQETYQQIASLQSWSTRPGFAGYTSPPTPEGTIAGINGTIVPHMNGFSGLNQQAFQQSPFQFAVQPVPVPRGRSSSMLSQYSGFTDDGDDMQFMEAVQHPQTWPVHASAMAGNIMMDDRKESEGSGSNTNDSTGSNSPRPEAKPFVPSKMGPIGPPSSRNGHKATQSPGQVPSVLGNGR